MSQYAGYGTDVNALADQERGGCVPEAVQRDQGKLWFAFLAVGVVIRNNSSESLVRCFKPHLGAIPLNENMVISAPLRADGKPVSLLCCFPAFCKVSHQSRNCQCADGSCCLGGLSSDFGCPFAVSRSGRYVVERVIFLSWLSRPQLTVIR